ncbi:hypothetical protein NA57DRAFT_59980 [Rhizodiscina lignyota]|uniref:Uncharacterized protein n=1 Tax=Rhizodiscina lignyota TaxID=1504668 RepID=A0A9P4M325_9PEZI|nr:hypothetical protein NA57DRAFT_59980 [Rhizodiscina lignyota]
MSIVERQSGVIGDAYCRFRLSAASWPMARASSRDWVSTCSAGQWAGGRVGSTMFCLFAAVPEAFVSECAVADQTAPSSGMPAELVAACKPLPTPHSPLPRERLAPAAARFFELCGKLASRHCFLSKWQWLYYSFVNLNWPISRHLPVSTTIRAYLRLEGLPQELTCKACLFLPVSRSARRKCKTLHSRPSKWRRREMAARASESALYLALCVPEWTTVEMPQCERTVTIRTLHL